MDEDALGHDHCGQCRARAPDVGLPPGKEGAHDMSSSDCKRVRGFLYLSPSLRCAHWSPDSGVVVFHSHRYLTVTRVTGCCRRALNAIKRRALSPAHIATRSVAGGSLERRNSEPFRRRASFAFRLRRARRDSPPYLLARFSFGQQPVRCPVLNVEVRSLAIRFPRKSVPPGLIRAVYGI